MKDSATQYKLRYAKQKYKRVPLDLPLEMYASIKSMCAARGEPVNAYIKRLISQDVSASMPALESQLVSSLFTKNSNLELLPGIGT